MLCTYNPTSQPGLDMYPLWFPLIDKKLHELICIHSWCTIMFELCCTVMILPTECTEGVVTTSHFNLLEKFYFVACSGPVISIFNKS